MTQHRQYFTVVTSFGFFHFIIFIILLLDFVYFFSQGAAAQHGLWPPHSRGFLIIHNDAKLSVELL
jgi:hypothetical protein